MKINNFPIYYQDMEKSPSNSNEKEKKAAKQRINTKKKPKVFYKAISKIIAYGFNER